MCFLLSQPLNQTATSLRVQMVEGTFCSSWHPANPPVLTLLKDKGRTKSLQHHDPEPP